MRYSTSHPAVSPQVELRHARRTWPLVVSFVLLLAWSMAPVWAQGTNGSSTACAQEGFVKLELVTGEGTCVISEPAPMVAAQAPPDFSERHSSADLSVMLPGAGEIVRAASLNTFVTGTVDQDDAFYSRSTLENAEVSLAGSDPILTFSATTIEAEASLLGPCGDALAGQGMVRIEGAKIGGLFGAGVTVPEYPAVNTVLINRPGVRVVLNERILTGSGFGSLRLITNAVHIQLDEANVKGLGVLSGDIILGHAATELSCGDELRPVWQGLKD